MASFYVSTSGNDGNPGTIGSPKRNIMGASGGLALLTAQAGDTLFIRGGTYTEELNSNNQTFPSGTSYGNAATIAAYPGETAILQLIQVAADYIIFGSTAGSLVVDGDLCSECYNDLVALGGTRMRFIDVEVRNNAAGNLVTINQGASFVEWLGGSVHDSVGNPAASPQGGYGFYVVGADNLVEHVEIYGTTGYGIHNFSAHSGQKPDRNVYRFNEIYGVLGGSGYNAGTGMLLGSGDNNVAYGNIIRDNTGDGVQISNGSTNSKFYNNTVYGNNYTGISYGGIVYGTGSGTIIKNNIAYLNLSTGGGCCGDIVDSSFVQTPIFSANWLTSDGDPLFISEAADDYHLQGGSPVVNQGDDLGTTYDEDYDGVTRPVGAWEIGAYEFVSGVVPTPGTPHTAQISIIM